MKTVITSSDNGLSATFDKRFGRAAWYCVFDEQTTETTFVNNQNINASNGAGIKAAERMVELGIKRVISGDFGPKAKELLDKFEVKMETLTEEGLTIDDIVKRIK